MRQRSWTSRRACVEVLVLREEVALGHRLDTGAYHGVTTTQSVFWNTQGLAYMSGKNFIVLSHQLGWG